MRSAERLAQGLLGLLGRLAQLDHEARVGLRVEVGVVALQRVEGVVDQHLVEVVAAEPHVALEVERREGPAGHHQDRDVEGAAAEVVDDQRLGVGVGAGVHAVGDRRRGGLSSRILITLRPAWRPALRVASFWIWLK